MHSLSIEQHPKRSEMTALQEQNYQLMMLTLESVISRIHKEVISKPNIGLLTVLGNISVDPTDLTGRYDFSSRSGDENLLTLLAYLKTPILEINKFPLEEFNNLDNLKESLYEYLLI